MDEATAHQLGRQGMFLPIVTRSQWGAVPPSGVINKTTWSQRDGFVVHYGGFNAPTDPAASLRAIQKKDMAPEPDGNGYVDIGYNMIVDVNGIIYEGRAGGALAIGAHSRNNNTANFGICFLGHNADVTDKAKTSIRAVYDDLCWKSSRILAKRYHGQLNPTDCPGDNLRNWVIAGMPSPGEDMTTPEIDAINWRLYDFLQLHDEVTGSSVVLGEPIPAAVLLVSMQQQILDIQAKLAGLDLEAMTVAVAAAARAGAQLGASVVADEVARETADELAERLTNGTD